MVKFCDSLMNSGSFKEGIKKLVKKIPSGFMKSKESEKNKNDDLNDFTSCLETPKFDLNSKRFNNKMIEHTPKSTHSPRKSLSPKVVPMEENKNKNKELKEKEKENENNKQEKSERLEGTKEKVQKRKNEENKNFTCTKNNGFEKEFIKNKKKKNNKFDKVEKCSKNNESDKSSRLNGYNKNGSNDHKNKASGLLNNTKANEKFKEKFKLKFKNFNGTVNEFKALLDSNVKKLGVYNKINFRPNKIVVSLESRNMLDSYLEFYNKYNYNDQILLVSLLDYYSTVKSDYKSLNLYGIPEEYENEEDKDKSNENEKDKYDLESVEKGLRRRINLDFRLSKDEENNSYKLSFKNVSDCVKANSILNNTRIPLVKNKSEKLIKVTTSMEVFGKSSRNSSRVFVRNLPFDVSYEELSKFFKGYDKGAKVHIPSNSKGYAFVTFSSLEKSKKIINELNGSMYKKRRIQLTLSLPKQLYSTNQNNLNGNDKDKEQQEEKNKKHKEQVENKENENKINGCNKKEEYNNDDDKEPEEEESYENEEDQEDSSADSEEVNEQNLEDDEENQEENKDILDDTIFIRNLDYNCSESELMEYFSKFGSVESCKVCLKEDGSSKGTAFVRFRSREDVKKILEHEKLSLLRDEELNSNKPVVGIGFSLRGRRLKVDSALVKEKAKTLKAQVSEEENKKKEKEQVEKNLHLLMVGVVTEDSPQFKALSENQQESVKQSLEQKLEKIKQKNTYVNPTRICIKNLPSNINSNDLRNVINKYLKRTVSQEEYMELKKLKNRGVVDVRLIKGDSYTKDEQGVKVKKKKPFAFVELVNHNIAMKTLEYFSNNSSLYHPKVLQCEFTIDTRYSSKEFRNKSQKNRLRKKKYSRGKRQREKRRLLKLTQTN